MPALERMPEEHIYQAYGIYLLTSQHRLIRRLKRAYEPSAYGNKTWRASFLLMDYLLHNPPRRGARGMELGCGWGTGAVFCARRFKAKMTCLDLDKNVFPFLEVIAALNDVSRRRPGGQLQELERRAAGAGVHARRRRHLLLGQPGEAALRRRRTRHGRRRQAGGDRRSRTPHVLRAGGLLRQARMAHVAAGVVRCRALAHDWRGA